MMASRSRLAPLIVAILAVSWPAAAQIDLTGEWRSVANETGHSDIGDYTGVPISDALRQKADTWNPAEFSVPELQCRPHPMAHSIRPPNAAYAQFRQWKVVDPVTAQTVAWKQHGAWMEPERTIWMDGRPHPNEYAPHQWFGFSTGRWEGITLIVTTTHLKEGFVYPNGLTVSDKAVITEVFTRHGNYLMSSMFVEDPVYLTEPFLRTSVWVLDTGLLGLNERYPCGLNEVSVEVPHPRGYVPHHLPGTNTAILKEFAQKHGLPFEATRGGAETLYPEYLDKLRTMSPEPVQLAPLVPGATRRPR